MKYDCEIIRDLLPIYKDGVTNKKSSEIIEEHLKECEACEKYYNSLNEPEIALPDAVVKENQSIVTYGKRIRKRRRSVFAIVASAISVLLLGIFLMAAYLVVTGGPAIKTSDINNYGYFYNFKGYSNLYIFPTTIPQAARIDSYYYYQRDTFLDPTCQIYLEYSLSKEAYDTEVLRLSKIVETYENENFKGKENKIVYDTENFKYPAYVTIFNSNHCYEYALLNEEEHKIIYVFTQYIGLNKVKFDKKYLPKDFGDEKNSKGFNIYYSDAGNGLGYFERHRR